MSATTIEAAERAHVTRMSAIGAFGALLLRDLTVLRKNFGAFLLRTLMQPLLFVFVFTYVFPKIGQGVGGSGAGEARFSTLVVPGIVAIATIFQAIQSVGLPLVSEFGYTREIEDRVMAPLPVWAVCVQKIVSGAMQASIAAVIVFPLAALIPTTSVHLHIQWFYLLTALPLSALLGGALGIVIGTRAEPRTVPLVFSVIIIPITFLGATYYPWATLSPIAWLKWLVLLNPLVYVSEAYRLAVTPNFPHMPTLGVYGALIGTTLLLTALGVQGFNKRVLS